MNNIRVNLLLFAITVNVMLKLTTDSVEDVLTPHP